MPFWWGDRRCIGLVLILSEENTEWLVPEIEGAYPTFATTATEDDKRKEISQAIEREKIINVIKTTEELLKEMFTKAIDEDYVVELEEGLLEYDGRFLRKRQSRLALHLLALQTKALKDACRMEQKQKNAAINNNIVG